MMNLTAKQHEQFVTGVSELMGELGARDIPVTYERLLWELDTDFGPLSLALHRRDESMNLFARFTGHGPFPHGANQYSGKFNFHEMGNQRARFSERLKEFLAYVEDRLRRIMTVKRSNPATPSQKFTLRVERTGYGEMLTASNGGKVFYGGDPSRDRDLKVLKDQVLAYYPNATFAWANAGRPDPEVQADLDTDDRPRQPLGIRVNPSGRPGFTPVLLTKDGSLRLAETPNELSSFRSRGWREASAKLHTKLDRLRVSDPNGWATLADSEFAAEDIDDALASLARGNPVEGRGKYRLHYMEPGARKGTFRRTVRAVDSVPEAEVFMNHHPDTAFLPASVMTPGNRHQRPDTVAILGDTRVHPSINRGAASMS